jgi:hypothetical protein
MSNAVSDHYKDHRKPRPRRAALGKVHRLACDRNLLREDLAIFFTAIDSEAARSGLLAPGQRVRARWRLPGSPLPQRSGD